WRLGLLEQPHTSAGRVPSRQGYTVYVKTMLPKAAERRDGHVRDYLRAHLRNVGNVFQAAAHAVSRLTRYMAVFVSPGFNMPVVERFHLVLLSPGQALLVIVTDRGAFRDIVLQLPGDIGCDELADIELLLNRRMTGKPLDETAELLCNDDADIAEAISSALKTLTERQKQPEVTVGGAYNLLGCGDPERLRRLLYQIESGEALAALAEHMAGDGVVFGLPGFEDAALVTIRVRSRRAGHTRAGAIGVVGPTRMPYASILPRLRMIGETLEEILSEEDYHV
ncbi:MAG: hypothetical protein FWD16_04820, partial [Clostridia bacterium]|nr:hypothetical protein [Clostridia bacterium]